MVIGICLDDRVDLLNGLNHNLLLVDGLQSGLLLWLWIKILGLWLELYRDSVGDIGQLSGLIKASRLRLRLLGDGLVLVHLI